MSEAAAVLARGLDEGELSSAAAALWERLAARSVPGALWERLDAGALRCTACAHRCVLSPGDKGICGVRFHDGRALRVPFGYVARRSVLPVEGMGFFHLRPGAAALGFGMFGCDLRCPYCATWQQSQALRDEAAGGGAPLPVTAEALVGEAVAAGCEVVCAAFNEPMISAEWTRAVLREARRRGLITALVTDGNTTPEALAYLRDATDALRVDLKAYDETAYLRLGGRMAPVVAGIREARRLGYWVEVATLVVPGLDDELAGLRGLARQLAGIDPAMPWHIQALEPRYRMAGFAPPPSPLLEAAALTAYGLGMRFVYVGGTGEAPGFCHTFCPGCGERLVERRGHEARAVRLVGGACPSCRAALPGVWSPSPEPPIS